MYAEIVPDNQYSVRGLWSLNGNAQDSSGSANHGTIYNAISDNFGKFGGCYSFNGSSAYIQCTTYLNLNSAFSCGAWVNPSQQATWLGIFTCYAHPYLYVSSDGRFYAGFYGSGGVGDMYDGNVNWDTWVWMVLTWNGTHLRLYINGDFAVAIQPGFSPYDNLFPFVIGGYYYTYLQYPFKGKIDGVFLMDQALTSEKVKALYNNMRGAYTFFQV